MRRRPGRAGSAVASAARALIEGRKGSHRRPRKAEQANRAGRMERVQSADRAVRDEEWADRALRGNSALAEVKQQDLVRLQRSWTSSSKAR